MSRNRAGQEAKLCVPLGLKCTGAWLGLCFGDCLVYGVRLRQWLDLGGTFPYRRQVHTIAGALGNVRHLVVHWVIVIFQSVTEDFAKHFPIQHDSKLSDSTVLGYTRDP